MVSMNEIDAFSNEDSIFSRGNESLKEMKLHAVIQKR